MTITLPSRYNNAVIRPADMTQGMLDLYNIVTQINNATTTASSGTGSAYKKASKNATRQMATRQQVVSNGAIGYTYHNNIVTEAPIVSIRPIFNNLFTSALTNVKFSVAPTADFSLINAPTGAWIDGTFSSLSSATGTINARLGVEQPSMTFGDWIDITSIPPTDGGLYKYCLRHFVPASNTFTSEGFYPLANFFHTPSAANYGRIFQTFRQDVDGIAVKSAFTQTTPNLAPGLIMGWQYQIAAGTIITIAGSGDSIMEGAVNGATGNFGNGWLFQSISLFRVAYPSVIVEFANFGISSQNTSTFQPLILERLPRIEPDLLIYSPFSPNDGIPSAANISTEAGLASSLQTAAKTANTPVCYVGGCCNTTQGWTQAQDLFRQFGNRFSQGNFRMSRGYVNMDPDLFDGVSAFKVGLSLDGTHPSEAADGLIAQNQGLPALKLMILGI